MKLEDGGKSRRCNFNYAKVMKRAGATAGVLAASLLAGSFALANQGSYTSPDAPRIIEWEVNGSHSDHITTYEIEVTDDFTVDGVSLTIDMFSPILGFVDIFLEAPDGTQITIVDYACGGDPLAWGTRVYRSDEDSPTAVEDGGIPASYTFADGGMPVGLDNFTDAGTACSNYYENRDRFTWTWPPEEAADWDDPRNPGTKFGNYRNVYGAFMKIPEGNLYGPQAGAFSDFDGKSALGTWTVTIRKWSSSGTPSSWLQADTKIQSIALNFGESGPTVTAESMIQNFMAARASRLLSEDLNLEDRLTNPQKGVSGNNALSFADGSGMVEYAFSFLDGFDERDPDRRYDIWARGAYHYNSTPSGGVDSFIGHFGADYWFNRNLLVGALVTIDSAEQVGTPQQDILGIGTMTPKVEGIGWLAGPYVVARPFDGLFLNGRAQWGMTDNTIYLPSYGNMFTGQFDTQRFLVQGEVTGRKKISNFLFEPSLSAGYTQDKTNGSTTLTGDASISSTIAPSNSSTIVADEIDVSEGRLTFAQRISYEIESNGFVIVPSVSLAGIWQFDAPDYVDSNGQRLYGESADPFLRVEGLLRASNPQGINLLAGISYEGIGAVDWEAYNASLSLNIPF